MANTPHTNLPLVAEAQAGAHITHNTAVALLDSFVFPALDDRAVNSPPGSPTNGYRCLVGGSPTGAFDGHSGHVAVYWAGWYFFVPKEGWRFLVKDEDVWTSYDGSAWHDDDYVTTAVMNAAISAGIDQTKWTAARCATTANVSISGGGLAAGQVIDGVTLVAGDVVLVKDQSAPAENGLYVAPSSGAASRQSGADTGAELAGKVAVVAAGTVAHDRVYVCTNDSITLGSTAVVWTRAPTAEGGLLAANNLNDVANADTAITNLGGASPIGAGGLVRRTGLKKSMIASTDPNGDVLATGDGQAFFFVPPDWDGHKLTSVFAALTTVGATTDLKVQLRNVTQGWDMLTTKLQVDAGERTSLTAGTAAVIDTASSHDVLTAGDLIAVDVDQVGTLQKGLFVWIQGTPQ